MWLDLLFDLNIIILWINRIIKILRVIMISNIKLIYGLLCLLFFVVEFYMFLNKMVLFMIFVILVLFL